MSRRWPQVLVELIGLGTRKKDSLMETGSSWVVSCFVVFWFDLDINRLVTSSRSGFDWIPPPPAKVNGISCWCVFSFVFISVVSLDHGKHYPLSGTSSKNQRFMMDFLMISYVHHISLRSPCRMVQTSHTFTAESNTPYALRHGKHRLRRLDWVIVPDRGAKHLFRFQDRPLFVGWFSRCFFPMWFPSI